METAEVTSRQPEDAEVAQPMPRFVVIVGDPADGGSAFRIENPARLLRVWSLLRATREQLDSATLPPAGMPGLQRQLQSIRRELELAVSPPLVSEFRRILPSHDATPSAGALRIESAAMESWVGSLVVQMLGVFVGAPERSQQGDSSPAQSQRPARGAAPLRTPRLPTASPRERSPLNCQIAEPDHDQLRHPRRRAQRGDPGQARPQTAVRAWTAGP